ncbi:MAG: hypothetical protein J5594_01135 [Elusimicrobiaceae bacterium]|nr:hypothetical protein [Elusimicrobiaceae bacterium]
MALKYSAVMDQLYHAFKEKFPMKNTYMLSGADVQEMTTGFWNLLGQRLQSKTTGQKELLKHYSLLLGKQIFKALRLAHPEQKESFCKKQAAEICEHFLYSLPEIQQVLFTDIRAAYEGDPAAIDEMETLLCYPGIMAVTYQRMAHILYQQGVRILPRMMTELAHQATGIDIHPGAEIGPAFFIDHGTGVVIGETSVIGEHVKLYQGVTLGAKSFPLDKDGHPIKGIKRHPNIGNNVIIYAETTILGPVTIGEGAIIGANKWITKDVPANAKID